MPKRFISPAILVSLCACASDPHKEVRSAETQLNQSQLQGDNKQTPDDATPAEKRDAQEATARDVVSAKAKLEEARVNMQRERQLFTVEAQARFDKADARAAEAKTRSSKLTGKEASDFVGAWKMVQLTRADAIKKLGNLPAMSDDIWKTERRNTERSLSAFEQAVVDAFKDL
ncbi:MAG: hypothetical protein U0174_27060 [Polyangiaceae bacterium]